MAKIPCWHHLPPASGGPRRAGFWGWLGVLLLSGCFAFSACAQLQPQPAAFDPQVYTPIEYHDLLAMRQAGLHAGQKVRVKAYFWQYLNYDPVMRNYLTLLRYPIRWYQLLWFATYGTDDMTGYFDLAAITADQAEKYQLQRLDPVLLYGELSSLGPGLFLQVFHVEKIADDD